MVFELLLYLFYMFRLHVGFSFTCFFFISCLLFYSLHFYTSPVLLFSTFFRFYSLLGEGSLVIRYMFSGLGFGGFGWVAMIGDVDAWCTLYAICCMPCRIS